MPACSHDRRGRNSAQMVTPFEHPQLLEITNRIRSERFPSAELLFCAGSVVRGEGFPSSDLDLVVLSRSVPSAWRESFNFEGWPVEVFAHDVETLAYFIANDCKSGRPSLAQMIAEALVVPGATAYSNSLQTWARQLLEKGPPPPNSSELEQLRYTITDLLHDLRDDRAPEELRAIACDLYARVCNFVLRARGHWLGAGKTLPRRVHTVAPELHTEIEHAFTTFFTAGDRGPLLRVVQQILGPFGGECFEGFRAIAPASNRLTNSDIPRFP